MVVTRDPWRRHKSAHREGVNQFIVEVLIRKCVGRRDLAFAAGRANWLRKGEGLLVHAKSVLGGITDKGFGVDGAAEMAMEIGALRHMPKERIQLARIVTGGLHDARGALFRVQFGARRQFFRRRLAKDRAGDKNERAYRTNEAVIVAKKYWRGGTCG